MGEDGKRPRYGFWRPFVCLRCSDRAAIPLFVVALVLCVAFLSVNVLFTLRTNW